jgi:hypothetical protein
MNELSMSIFLSFFYAFFQIYQHLFGLIHKIFREVDSVLYGCIDHLFISHFEKSQSLRNSVRVWDKKKITFFETKSKIWSHHHVPEINKF